MTKHEFMARLASELHKRNVADAADVIEEYEQHFAFKLADGYSEEEIAAKLGSPEELAAQFESDNAPKAARGSRALTVAGLCFADLFAGLFFVLLAGFGLVMAAAALCFAALAICLLGGWNIAGLIPAMPYWCGAILALSFAAFLISGILGSVNYYQSGNLDLKTAGVLSAGSFVGALAGVKINLLIPADTMKIILYLVVLLSGISILLRKDKPGNTEKKAVQSVPFYLVLGAVTGAVCAASGAGGPVLVMPILTLLGIPAHTAVGISLFDSIFIAVPSAAGYLIAAAGNKEVFLLLPVLLIAHGIGVFAGSKNATKINQTLLKRIVAVASIAIACIKLFL